MLTFPSTSVLPIRVVPRTITRSAKSNVPGTEKSPSTMKMPAPEMVPPPSTLS
jgi:hypothetical protein